MKLYLQKRTYLLALSLGLISAAAVYWTVPYAELTIIYSWQWPLSAFLAGTIGGILTKNPPLSISLKITAGTAIAILLRVLYEIIFIDPTLHNLWPIALILALAIAFPSILIGAWLPHFLNKIRQKP